MDEDRIYSTGADASPYDIRTFAYAPSGIPPSGGVDYAPDDIEDQHKVGICTAISVTQNARKALGIPFSADFQYLMQKKYRDGNWNEGSSLSSALWVAKNFGLLPAKHWKFTTEKDRKKPYHEYIELLKAIPESEIEKLKKIAKPYAIKAYASVVVDPTMMAQAILESKAGILARFAIGKEWWTKPIEPLRPPVVKISGHAVSLGRFITDTFRVVNTWGTDWAKKGTANFNFPTYRPTEAWIPYYNAVPQNVEDQLKKRLALQGQLLDLLQQLIRVLSKK